MAADWVKQSVRLTGTPSTLKRIDYLDDLVPDVDAIIVQYFDREPDGSKVTLEALRLIGRDRLQRTATKYKKDLDTVKQDFGRLVVVRVVERYGADRVVTYRGHGFAPSTRAAGKDGPDWVGAYTPHRVLPAPNAEDSHPDTLIAPVEGDHEVFGKEVVNVRRLVGEYQFELDRIPIPITIRLFEDLRTGAVEFEQSHFIKTPLQADSYRTSRPVNDNARRALSQAMFFFLLHYREAVRKGHTPDASWLVPA